VWERGFIHIQHPIVCIHNTPSECALSIITMSLSDVSPGSPPRRCRPRTPHSGLPAGTEIQCPLKLEHRGVRSFGPRRRSGEGRRRRCRASRHVLPVLVLIPIVIEHDARLQVMRSRHLLGLRPRRPLSWVEPSRGLGHRGGGRRPRRPLSWVKPSRGLGHRGGGRLPRPRWRLRLLPRRLLGRLLHQLHRLILVEPHVRRVRRPSGRQLLRVRGAPHVVALVSQPHPHKDAHVKLSDEAEEARARVGAAGERGGGVGAVPGG